MGAGIGVFRDLTGIDLRVSRAVPPGAWRQRRDWLLEELESLRAVLGLEPRDLGIRAIHLAPGPELVRALGLVECGGVGQIGARDVWLSADLGPGPGALRRGMEKANDGTLRGVLRHEVGHALERRLVDRTGIDLVASMRRGDPKADLTHYAGTGRLRSSGDVLAPENPSEYFAEAFSCYAHPDGPGDVVIEPELLTALRKAFPRK